MKDVFYIEDVDQAMTLLKPARLELIKRLDQPRTCPELAQYFGDVPQKIYYHIKALEKAGLVEKVGERRVRGAVEGFYQAAARAYWLAPHLVSKIGGKQLTQDQISLRVLLDLAEEVQDDIGRLGSRSEAGNKVPSLSLSAHIQLPDGQRRAEFLQEVQTLFQDLATQYGAQEEVASNTDTQDFRLILMCYPKEDGK